MKNLWYNIKDSMKEFGTMEKEQNTNDEKHAVQVSHVRGRRQIDV